MKRINYRKIWEEHHGMKIPEGKEIHHIDGDKTNNDIENLKLVSLEEHLEIHKKQKDWGAVQAICMRIENSDKNLMREAARQKQIGLVKEGKHNFQVFADKRKENHAKVMAKRLKEHGQAFLGIDDPVENGRKGGLAAKEKKAGFLNTASDNHGSKHVKGTKWWTNSKGESVRSVECPGNDWKRGMKYND